jgi:hypothetical protein
MMSAPELLTELTVGGISRVKGPEHVKVRVHEKPQRATEGGGFKKSRRTGETHRLVPLIDSVSRLTVNSKS